MSLDRRTTAKAGSTKGEFVMLECKIGLPTCLWLQILEIDNQLALLSLLEFTISTDNEVDKN